MTNEMFECKNENAGENRADGTVHGWIGAASLLSIRKSEYRHPPFGEDVRRVLRGIKATLGDAHSWTVEEMEDDFRRDMHPEREIAIWLHIAKVFHQCTAGKTTSLGQRKEYFTILLVCSMCPGELVLKVIKPKAISVAAARKAIEAFYRQDKATWSSTSVRLPAPITVQLLGTPKVA